MNEAEFGRSLSGMLKRQGLFCTRIESHGTGNGIPDLFVQGNGYDLWLELKRDPMLRPELNKIKVDWRPGQQAWALDYRSLHACYKQTLTIVKANVGYYIIPMIERHENNIVNDPIWVDKLSKWLLILLTHNRPWLSVSCTYREAVNNWMDYWFPGEDYDPEVIWNPTINIDHDLCPDVFIKEQVNMLQDLNKL